MPKLNNKNRGIALSGLITKNDIKFGAELGVWMGDTFKYLIENHDDLNMIGVDAYMEMPNNDGKASEKYLKSDPKNDWDHEKHYNNMLEFCKQYPDRTKIIRDLTDNACKMVDDESLDFIFVDAHHTEKSVYSDLKNWIPKVKIGGFLTGDDYHPYWDGVVRAVNRVFGGKNINKLNDSIWYIKKEKNNYFE